MAIVAITDIPAELGSRDQAEVWHERSKNTLPAAPGFVFHADGPTETGWRLIQVWDSENDLRRYFEEHVLPQLPPGAPSMADTTKTYPVEHVIAGNLQAV